MASFEWPPGRSGGGGGGIASINGDTTSAQLIVSASTGTDFTIATAGGTTTVAIPTASASNRGLLSSADWTTFNSKQSALTLGNLTDAGTDGIFVTGGTGAVVGSGTSIAQHVADTSHNGYLSSTDWNTFNGKQASLTIGNLTDAGTDGITVTGGTGSVIGSGTSLSQHVADATHNGYLSSADWVTFNAKGSGTVTAITIASTNGFAGSSSGGATPALTISTSITGILQGNGTAISAATTTGSGNVVLATAPTMTNPVVGTQTQGDSSTKAASTSYVDVAVANAVAGINPAVAVQAATTAAGDTSGFTYNNGASGIGAFFTGSVNTAVTIDGYTFTAVGQRLLVKNDTQSPSGAFNGVYYVTQIQTGILAPIFTRALDYDTPSDMNNTGAIPVINGTVNGTTSWVLTSLVVTVGTTPLVFTEFTRNPADYLLKANNLSDVASASTAINNILPAQGSSSGKFLTTNGSVCSWGTPAGGSGPIYYVGTYPASSTNYWFNEEYTSSFANYTEVGTIPSPTVIVNVGFTTPTLPTGHYPGLTFTAPSTGVIEVNFHVAITNSGSALCGVQLFESGGSTVLDNGVIYPAGAIVQTPLRGFLSVTASSSYTVVVRGNASTGNNYIYLAGLTPNDSTTSMVSMGLKYISIS